MNRDLKPFEWTEDLRKYQELLEDSAKSNSNWPILNEGNEHAAILMTTIFKHATQYVYMYSNSFNTDITSYDIYYEALKGCIERQVKVEVLLKDKPKANNLSLQLIKDSNKGSVRVLNSFQYDTLTKVLNSENINFAVADDKIYRLEYDTEKRKATSSFNAANIAEVLKEKFMSVN